MMNVPVRQARNQGGIRQWQGRDPLSPEQRQVMAGMAAMQARNAADPRLNGQAARRTGGAA